MVASTQDLGIADERFWRKVDTSADCWVWTGKLTKFGYIRIRRSKKLFLAHRWIWSLIHGDIPHGMKICHHCDNRSCVRPEHLFLGTQAENIADMIAKRRHLMGEKRHSSKLIEEDIRQIRLLKTTGLSNDKIAVRFGVSTPTIWSIVNGRKWKHVA